ncbi:MAG: Ppx/GppA phosphatase family protein, partial [Sulfuricaulis sp.]
ELILGVRTEPQLMESLYMGCVSLSRQYFPKGRITEKAMHRAETAARLELTPVEAQFRRGWQRAYGSSGTVRAIGAVAQAGGWTIDDEITPAVLERLRGVLLNAGQVTALDLPGLSADRASVLPGGVAILRAAFEALGIERLHIANAALREGLLYDLLGRLHHVDAREQTLHALTARFNVDKAQAERVVRTAQACFEQVAQHWKLAPEDAATLSLAARLHEIGLAVAHSGYHKHGAYLARYSDLPGFSSTEQHLLALLIRAHRRKFPAEEFAALPKGQAKHVCRLVVLLRLAVLLHRGRSDTLLPAFRLTVGKHAIEVRFPRGWLNKNPLTRADLALEADYLKSARMQLRFG